MNPSRLIYLIFIIELFLSGFWYTSSAITQAFLLAAVLIGCRAVLARGEILAHSLFGLMLLYLAWLFIVALNSEVPRTSMMTLATLANLPVIYLVASNTPTFAEIWKYLRIALFVIGVFFAGWALWQVVFFVDAGDAVGPLKDRNLFAALINVLWFPAAFLFLSSSSARFHWKSILFGAGLLIMSTALFATTSRGGIGTWVLLLPLLLWAGYRNTYSRRLVVFIPLIAILAYSCSTLTLQENFTDRTFQLTQDPSTAARLLLWQSAIKMTFSHPFIGTGWGTFASYYPVYRSPLENGSAGFFAHNDYLQMAAEGGLFALLLQLSLLLGVLLQLKRGLRHAADLAGLESIALLLGTLALFIHAGVNFIFYVAFMNILAGLYLARVAQLTDKPRIMVFPGIKKFSLPFKRHMLVGLIALFIMLPLAPNLVAELLNQQSNIKVANLTSPNVNAYKIAKFITRFKPENFIAQEIVLRTAELALADSAFVSSVGVVFQRELINETLERFDAVRALTANNPKLGVRQAGILITNHAILDVNITNGNTAYLKAYQVLSTNLKVNPYHTDSIILLARLYSLEGRHVDALHILKQAEHRVFGHVNQSLITIEILRQLAAPEIIPELAEIERQLRLANSDVEIYKLSVVEGHFNENIDARLSALASRISR